MRATATLLAGLGAVLLAFIWFGAESEPSAPEPVDPHSLYDPIVAGEGFEGGIRWVVARDGIRPIYEPEFVEGRESPLRDDDLVLGLVVGADARAYPIGYLASREIVNDVVGGVPVIVSWCPLCGTGTVHRREIGGDAVLFGNQGALWKGAMTWWDHETGSIWSQPLGEAIAGPLRGEKLELLPATLTTWESWLATHPETLVLDAPLRPAGPNDHNVALVVSLRDESVAYPMSLLRDRGIISDVVGGVPIAIAMDGGGSWGVYSRRLDDRTLDLRLEGDALVSSGGSSWRVATGESLDSSPRLVSLPVLTSFEDDFRILWPDGLVFGG